MAPTHHHLCYFLLAACWWPAIGLANDSMAELAAGGIEFKKSNAVVMEKEDLAIALDAIEVDYQFKNHGKAPVTATVAFPIPTFQIGNQYEQKREQEPFADFQVWVDDLPIEVQKTVQVFAPDDGSEKHDFARMLSQYFTNLGDADVATGEVEKLADPVMDELVEQGLLERFANDQPPIPKWRLKITYHWTQVFPVGQAIHIRHRYTPSVGGTTMCSGDCLSDQRYCVSEGGILPWVKNHGPVGASWVDYILTTGANWNGPIKDFHLTLTKPNAETRVSLCFDKIKKTGPLTFESHLENFTPTRDLQVLFLR